jgi:RNA polymerase sigma factor (sigma-70 family)
LDEQTTDGRPGVDVCVEHESILHTVRTRLQQVAGGDRRALLLYAVKEMSYGEIGRVLGVSVNAVKSRISRARESLKGAGRARQNGDRP